MSDNEAVSQQNLSNSKFIFIWMLNSFQLFFDIKVESIHRKAYKLEIESKSSQIQTIVSSHQNYQSQTITNSTKDLNEFVQDHNKHCKSILDAFNDLDLPQDLLGDSQSVKNMFSLDFLNKTPEPQPDQNSVPDQKGKFQITGICLEERSGFNPNKQQDEENNNKQ